MVVDVTDYGAVGDGVTNCREAIRQAIETNPPGSIITFPAGNYSCSMLNGEIASVRSGQTLAFSPGATVSLKAQSTDSYKMFNLASVQDVQILGGTFIGDRDIHVGNTGQQGTCIWISGNSKRILLDRVRCENGWGDGVYIGAGGGLTDITVRHSTFHNNRRNGLSITQCRDALVTGCTFTGNGGVGPSCGMELEPNLDWIAADVRTTDCLFANNVGPGYMATLSSQSPRHIVANCHARNNGTYGIYSASGDGTVIGCWATGNASDGIRMGNRISLVSSCQARSNGGVDIKITSGVESGLVIGCLTSEAISNDGAAVLADNYVVT